MILKYHIIGVINGMNLGIFSFVGPIQPVLSMQLILLIFYLSLSSNKLINYFSNKYTKKKIYLKSITTKPKTWENVYIIILIFSLN